MYLVAKSIYLAICRPDSGEIFTEEPSDLRTWRDHRTAPTRINKRGFAPDDWSPGHWERAM